VSSLAEALVKAERRALNLVKPLMRRVVPTSIRSALRLPGPSRYSQSRIESVWTKEWQAARLTRPWNPAANSMPGGINLVGYLKAAKGIGEAARSSALALRTAGIPYTVNDFETGVGASQQVEALPWQAEGTSFRFKANLMHINPPELPYLWETFGANDLTGRCNIAVWYWELPAFPANWAFAFDLVDEIWVGSQFVLDSVSAKSPVPVIKVPPCINPIFDNRLARSHFGLPDDLFLFLCAYDILSVQTRKNQMGAVDAFRRAFASGNSKVGLVVKINNADQNRRQVREFREKMRDLPNCYFIETTLTRLAMNSLIYLSDAYVSLHRAEGFGLIPAEAMGLGKPVIMTKWSGNLDFMTSANSCGVDYRLVPVDGDSWPYLPGQRWAEPDLDQAAVIMRRLYSDGNYRADISRHAKETIHSSFSPAIVGAIIEKRMQLAKLL
jgi:glycosyltransferase involved in cell wall biosynthesis